VIRAGRLPASLALGAALLSVSGARAVELPPSCAADPLPPDASTPLPELRRRVEAAAETDPHAALRWMCQAIPRVAREQGEDSVELAWWLGSLAMPLIAYMDRHAEARPLLAAAREILERRLGPQAEELADIHVAHAWIDYRQGRLAESREAWERALAIRQRHPGSREVELQKVLVGLAQVDVSLRDFSRARAELDRARQILQRNGETVSEAAAAIENVLTNVALREEDFTAARAHAEAQIAIESQLPGHAAQLVPAWVMLGQILERLDEYEASERAAREAVRLAESEQGPLQRHRLAALTQLAQLLFERGRPVEAQEAAESALALGETTLGPDAPRLVAVLQVLGDCRRALGRLGPALRLYERAAAIVERRPDDVERHTRVALQRGFGALLWSVGDAAAARDALRAALAVAGDSPTLSLERAEVLRALAAAADDAEAARALLLEALELYRSRLPAAHPRILRGVNDLCAVAVASGQTAAPDCDDADRRLAAAPETGPALRQAVLTQQSRRAALRGEPDLARDAAVAALAAAEALGTPEPLLAGYFELARRLAATGQREAAILFAKQAVAQVERVRGQFDAAERHLERGFVTDKAAVYRLLADWLMADGRLDEGLDVLRRLKGEELYDFVLRQAGGAAAAEPVALSPAEERLWNGYVAASGSDAAASAELSRLDRLCEADRLSTAEAARLAELLAGQDAAQSARARRIREFLAAPSAPRAVPERSGRDRALGPEQARFGPDSALALYLLADTHVRLLVATRRGTEAFELPLGAAALGVRVGELLERIGRREDVTAQTRALYEDIARPLDEAARRAGATRLVLWLDGVLRYVPFGALGDGRQDLVERYAIELYAPAGESGAAGPPAPREVTVRGLGVTRGVAGYRPLPAVADELCAVVRGPIDGLESPGAGCTGPAAGAGALPGAGFADGAFTEQRLRELLAGPRDFSVLHVSTHFSLRPGNALRSYFVLGDGSKLTLEALAALDFSGVELLTLSACQTALGGATGQDGREIEGLSAVIQRRGARRVVASLWPVEDRSTAWLMGEMYRGLAAGDVPASAALRRAQLALRARREDGRRPFAHPYYWAGFVLSAAEASASASKPTRRPSTADRTRSRIRSTPS